MQVSRRHWEIPMLFALSEKPPIGEKKRMGI